MSEAWFNRERWKGTGPRFLKMEGRGGRVLYPIEELERYFSSRLRKSTSDAGPAVKTLPEGSLTAKVRQIGKRKEETSTSGSTPLTGQGGVGHV